MEVIVLRAEALAKLAIDGTLCIIAAVFGMGDTTDIRAHFRRGRVEKERKLQAWKYDTVCRKRTHVH